MPSSSPTVSTTNTSYSRTGEYMKGGAKSRLPLVTCKEIGHVARVALDYLSMLTTGIVWLRRAGRRTQHTSYVEYYSVEYSSASFESSWRCNGQDNESPQSGRT